MPLNRLMKRPALFKLVLSLYPPFLGAGVRVAKVSPNFRRVEATMPLGLRSRNVYGVIFGGSLYAMADPFYALMLYQILGRDYLIWDSKATIEFVKPAASRVRAVFEVSEERSREIIDLAASGKAVFPEFQTGITDVSGETVALIRKKLYVRLKPGARPA